MRRCYFHVGASKTGTTAIQAFLCQNRESLLDQGILAPKSGRGRFGAHHSLVRVLSGAPVMPQHALAGEEFIRELSTTACQDIVLSSEWTSAIRSNRSYATRLFSTLRSLDLDVRLILYVRHQPQRINSSYCQLIKSFGECVSFEDFVRGNPVGDQPYLAWHRLAKSYNLPLVVRPYTGPIRSGGLIADFLSSIGASLNPGYVLPSIVNDSPGPFAISVARHLVRTVVGGTGRLTVMQANKCQAALVARLAQVSIKDGKYCGLTPELARLIEHRSADTNRTFAEAVWGESWDSVFEEDVGKDFAPNDYAVTGIPPERRSAYEWIIEEMTGAIGGILANKALANGAPWNLPPARGSHRFRAPSR